MQLAQRQQAARQEAAKQLAAVRQAAAEAQREERNQSLGQRLDIADSLRTNGDISAAVRLYLRLAANRNDDSGTADSARDRLAELIQEAESKAQEIKSRLADYDTETGVANKLEDDALLAVFAELESTARKYSSVPGAGDKLEHQVAKLRQQPRLAALLYEPEANELLLRGQGHAKQEQLCCSYLFYEEAARLSPAPSAIEAGELLAELKKDPEMEAAAKQCRDLQWCHKTFDRAERLLDLRPARAAELFQQIAKRAPSDSEIYRVARVRMLELEGN